MPSLAIHLLVISLKNVFVEEVHIFWAIWQKLVVCWHICTVAKGNFIVVQNTLIYFECSVCTEIIFPTPYSIPYKTPWKQMFPFLNSDFLWWWAYFRWPDQMTSSTWLRSTLPPLFIPPPPHPYTWEKLVTPQIMVIFNDRHVPNDHFKQPLTFDWEGWDASRLRGKKWRREPSNIFSVKTHLLDVATKHMSANMDP